MQGSKDTSMKADRFGQVNGLGRIRRIRMPCNSDSPRAFGCVCGCEALVGVEGAQNAQNPFPLLYRTAS